MSDGGSACLNIRGLVEFLNSILRMEAETWGDPVDAVLLRTIHLGEQEGRDVGEDQPPNQRWHAGISS